MQLTSTLLAGSLAVVCRAASHYMYAGNLNLPGAIHLFEFDDVARTIQQVKSFPVDTAHNWITLDVSHPNIGQSTVT